MTDLRPDDFAAYFEAVHGTTPFPWQDRLLRRVMEGGWPDLLDLPTGTGKTAVIDIALFHLALEAGAEQRQAPLRIVLVVDRRTVVDQAYDRAQKIATALKGASKSRPALCAVRDRLSKLSGREPLAVAVLRGGIVRDDSWARNPAQPLVAVSTVDQVGSRLLFRGYGVSNSMRPVHAGLLGNDALLLLDEVHLSEPFRQTLMAIAKRYRGWEERRLPDRWHVVSMSATPSGEAQGRFALDDADRSDPVLRMRLQAPKPVQVLEVKVAGDAATRQRRFAERLAEEAAHPGNIPGAAIAVVVNRVRTARLVFERLRQDHGQSAAIYLLTGRMRPLEREEVESEIRQRVGAGRAPRVPLDGKATFVVATQCIEAGADFDFDVLITECASLDALKQRFGRLNRLGEAERCRGAVLMRSDQVAEEDPIYGRALYETWKFLERLGPEVDFGLSALKITPEVLESLVVQPTYAPILLPAHLDTWVQTSPVPDPDPDVALWLHGPRATEPDVQIVWRADIDHALLVESMTAADALEQLLERIEICPPLTAEAASIPLSAARRWLATGDPDSSATDDAADVEGSRAETEDEVGSQSGRPALVWGGERSEVVHPNRGGRRLGPGDTLVVPSEYGGLADGSWAPESQEPVPDLGDRAAYQSRRRRVLRLHEAVWRWNLGSNATALPTAVLSLPKKPAAEDGEEDEGEFLDDWLREAQQFDLPAWLSEVVRGLTSRRQRRILRVSSAPGQPVENGYYSVVGRPGGEATTEDEVASFTGIEVPLEDHLRGVGAFARDFGDRCGLPAQLVTALEMAGQWHDIGKADHRFQRLLHGGNAFKTAIAETLLAKSSLSPLDRRARRRARERSEYPPGYRHELMSVALMLQNPEAVSKSSEVDLDLVLHLVSSHHGWCRPLAPVARDDAPIDVEYGNGISRLRARSDHGLERLDSGVSDRFFRLVRRYGWFGLAWLEAILRLADHRRSEWEQTNGEEVP